MAREVAFVIPIEFLKAPSLSSKQDHDAASFTVATDPTPAQMEAGNYRKGHIQWNGLQIAIETPRGGTRKAKDGSWKVENLPAHYGYVKRTEGADGDHVDVYMGSNPESDKVFIIDQKNLETGDFDEHKCMLGFHHVDAARKVYSDSFSDGGGISRIAGIAEVTVAEFKEWLKSGVCKEPFCMPELQSTAALFEYLLSKHQAQEALGAPQGHEFYGNQHTGSKGGGDSDKKESDGKQKERKPNAEVTRDFEQKWQSDRQGMIKKYLDHPESRDKLGTRVISADVAKELSEDYSASKENRGLYAGDVHETASAIAKAAYDDVLESPIEEGRTNAIMFTAGGPGVGKSSGQDAGGELKNISETAHAVVDGNMASAESASVRIDKALGKGMNVPIVHVYRDPEESYLEGVVPRGERMGRAVSIDSAMLIHQQSNEAILKVQDKYKNDPRVSVRFVDNSLGRGNAKLVSTVPNKGPRTRSEYKAVAERLRVKVQKLYDDGKISQSIYEGAMRRDVKDSS